MNNFCIPTTYEEARRMGVYWDWNSILLANIGDKERYIAIALLKKGVSVENVYEVVGLLEEERKLKNADYWKRICAAVNDKDTEMSVCFRAILNERICEITQKLLEKRRKLSLTNDDISEIIGLVTCKK